MPESFQSVCRDFYVNQKLALKMDLPFLGEVPIDLEIRAGCDQGTPLVVGHPDSPQAKAFLQMAQGLKAKLNL